MTRYLYLRNGTYYFRRRIAGYTQNSAHLMVSLACKDKSYALYLRNKMEMEFQTMLDSFITLHPPLPENLVRCYLKASLRKLVEDLQRQMRMAKMSGRFPDETQTTLELQKIVLRTILRHGLKKNFPILAIDPKWSPKTLETLLRLYNLELEALRTREGRERLQREFTRATGSKINILNDLEHECQIRECYLQAKLAAYETVHDGTKSVQKATLDFAKELYISKPLSSDQTTALPAPDGMQDPIEVSTISPTSEPRAPVIKPSVNTANDLTINRLLQLSDHAQNVIIPPGTLYPSDIASVYFRMAAANELSADVSKQRASDLRLFSLITGVLDVCDIQQFHLSQYRDILARIPKNFLRSHKDAELTIDGLMARSRFMDKHDIGLAPSTTKRHFKSLELLINRAKSEGHTLAGSLDIESLKPKQQARGPAHKKRAVFKFDELQNVFNHSAWQGFKGKSRHVSGENLIKDSRFWVPVTLAYTGARRAEIAGLMRDDIETIEGIPSFHIRANDYRSIKGENGEIEKSRIIPIHPHLIELGILEHAKCAPKSYTGLMFPDVLPKPRDKKAKRKPTDIKKIGESLDDFWRKSLNIALEGNPRALCMHSMRHYVNHQLIHSKDVHEVTRFDLLGHVESGASEQNVNTNTYRDETGVFEKFEAIKRLKKIF